MEPRTIGDRATSGDTLRASQMAPRSARGQARAQSGPRHAPLDVERRGGLPVGGVAHRRRRSHVGRRSPAGDNAGVTAPSVPAATNDWCSQRLVCHRGASGTAHQQVMVSAGCDRFRGSGDRPSGAQYDGRSRHGHGTHPSPIVSRRSSRALAGAAYGTLAEQRRAPTVQDYQADRGRRASCFRSLAGQSPRPPPSRAWQGRLDDR